MDCDNCFRVATKCLPKIKYFSPLDQVSYTLRNWYHKKRMMIQDRVKRLQNLSVKENYHPYYKSQIEKELYGGKKIKNFTMEKCKKCNQERKDQVMLYIKHQLITKIFDFFGTNENFLTETEKQIVEKYLFRYGKKIICKEWKGKDYYYQKIFGVSYYLKDVIDKERYQERKRLNLDSTIYFHPKASNGFAQECWEAIDAYQTMYHQLYNNKKEKDTK